MSKNHKSECWVLNYIDHSLIVISLMTFLQLSLVLYCDKNLFLLKELQNIEDFLVLA